MNLLECTVTKVLSNPEYIGKHDFWIIDVQYNCHGAIKETKIIKKTKNEIDEVKEGYVWIE